MFRGGNDLEAFDILFGHKPGIDIAVEDLWFELGLDRWIIVFPALRTNIIAISEAGTTFIALK
jgi:hypothetical protein